MRTASVSALSLLASLPATADTSIGASGVIAMSSSTAMFEARGPHEVAPNLSAGVALGVGTGAFLVEESTDHNTAYEAHAGITYLGCWHALCGGGLAHAATVNRRTDMAAVEAGLVAALGVRAYW